MVKLDTEEKSINDIASEVFEAVLTVLEKNIASHEDFGLPNTMQAIGTTLAIVARDCGMTQEDLKFAFSKTVEQIYEGDDVKH